MACYHPLKAFRIGVTDSGKSKLKIVSYNTDHLEEVQNQWLPIIHSYYSPYASRYASEYVQIPCGQCIGCRLGYSRQWADRMMCELQYHQDAFFITLTYNDPQLTRHCHSFTDPDPVTGEVLDSYTLNKRDCQLFFKRLRKALGDDKIRYFLAGEYGDQSFRPHYHAIIYGLRIPDLKLYKHTDQGFDLFTSEWLQRIWSDDFGPLGYVVIATVTWDTCAYVARYVTKKLKGESATFYKQSGLLPPFSLMSRKPGIGRQFYEEHKDEIVNNPTWVFPGQKKPHKFKPPRYFRSLLEVDNPTEYAIIRESTRRLAEMATERKLGRTDLSYLELLAVEEASVQDRVKSLDRSEC